MYAVLYTCQFKTNWNRDLTAKECMFFALSINNHNNENYNTNFGLLKMLAYFTLQFDFQGTTNIRMKEAGIHTLTDNNFCHSGNFG